jgi:flagellar protein FlaI
MRTLFERLTDPEPTDGCRCDLAFEGDRLVVDASDCPGGGHLATDPDCRATVVERLRERDADAVSTRSAGMERAYEDDAAAVLVAAGRFADAVDFRDSDLATRACRDPLGAAREATGRAGPVSDIAAETGLAELAARADGYEGALAPSVGPVISRARIGVRPPADARFESQRELDTGAVVRVYEQPATERRLYHLEPVEHELNERATATLSAAYDRLASGAVSGGVRAPARAVRRVADDEGKQDVRTLERVLQKHTRGYGVLVDLFADDRVSDVFATAPTGENRLRARVDGETMRTNVRLTTDGVEALASRFRRENGRAFSRASPTLDATATVGDRRVRIAGVTEPVSEGIAFAFRAHEREAWTLPAHVENGT